MKKLLFLPALLLVGLAFLATTAFMPGESPPAKKVWICHFAGHSGVVTDYVLLYRPNMPWPNQSANCEGRDGNLLYVSENAARRGHDARAVGRIDGYPD